MGSLPWHRGALLGAIRPLRRSDSRGGAPRPGAAPTGVAVKQKVMRGGLNKHHGNPSAWICSVSWTSGWTSRLMDEPGGCLADSSNANLDAGPLNCTLLIGSYDRESGVGRHLTSDTWSRRTTAPVYVSTAPRSEAAPRAGRLLSPPTPCASAATRCGPGSTSKAASMTCTSSRGRLGLGKRQPLHEKTRGRRRRARISTNRPPLMRRIRSALP